MYCVYCDYQTSSQQLPKEDGQRLHLVNGDLRSTEKPERSSPSTTSVASFQPILPTVSNGSNLLENAEVMARRELKTQSPFSPPVSMSSSRPTLVNSACDHFSTQYSQFLESVRGFQPLLADLNASIASVTNSVSTVGASVNGGKVTEGYLPGIEVQPYPPASAASRQPDGTSGVWLHSPVVLRSSLETGLTVGSNEGSPEQKENRQQGGKLWPIYTVNARLEYVMVERLIWIERFTWH